MAFDPFREYANHLLGTWRPASQVLTPDDELHILRAMREAQFLADKVTNRELKHRVACEETR